ncbi:hypothetical protein M8J76_006498 [Diaphorina citri]|nr:hypothetical protein M8J76_006498 [Diaphorina citri]
MRKRDIDEDVNEEMNKKEAVIKEELLARDVKVTGDFYTTLRSSDLSLAGRSQSGRQLRPHRHRLSEQENRNRIRFVNHHLAEDMGCNFINPPQTIATGKKKASPATTPDTRVQHMFHLLYSHVVGVRNTHNLSVNV